MNRGQQAINNYLEQVPQLLPVKVVVSYDQPKSTVVLDDPEFFGLSQSGKSVSIQQTTGVGNWHTVDNWLALSLITLWNRPDDLTTPLVLIPAWLAQKNRSLVVTW